MSVLSSCRIQRGKFVGKYLSKPKLFWVKNAWQKGGHSFCKQCLTHVQFMKTRSSLPNLSKLARAADISCPCAELFTKWMNFRRLKPRPFEFFWLSEHWLSIPWTNRNNQLGWMFGKPVPWRAGKIWMTFASLIMFIVCNWKMFTYVMLLVFFFHSGDVKWRVETVYNCITEQHLPASMEAFFRKFAFVSKTSNGRERGLSNLQS